MEIPLGDNNFVIIPIKNHKETLLWADIWMVRLDYKLGISLEKEQKNRSKNTLRDLIKNLLEKAKKIWIKAFS